MVPEFNITVAVAARFAVRFAAAVLLASVKEDFGARAAWSQTDFPEVIVFAQTNDVIFRHAKLNPDIMGFVIVLIYGCPYPILRHLEPFRNEFPSPGETLLFKVISEAEVSQHFEERTVSCRLSDVVDVSGTDTLLTGSHALRRRGFHSGKIRFQRCHSRVDNQKTLVILRNQRSTLSGIMTLADKEISEQISYFIQT